jgi:hypothetical protein
MAGILRGPQGRAFFGQTPGKRSALDGANAPGSFDRTSRSILKSTALQNLTERVIFP